MATSSTADFTESFAHLTLDNTDKLSTTDELSVHSLPDLQAFLELARHHDHEATKNDHKNQFHPAAISSHLTPLIRNDGYFQRRSMPMENASGLSDYKSTHHNTNNNHHSTNNNAASTSETDAAALFKTLQPFIDEYLARHDGGHLAPGTHFIPHEQDLDLDLKVEDTFDKVRRRSIESNRPSSPLTTPPQSSESRFTDSRGTFVVEDLCGPITNPEEYKHSKIGSNMYRSSILEPAVQGNADSNHFPGKRFAHSDPEFDAVSVPDSVGEPPQIYLADLTTHEIDLDAKDPHATEKTIAELRMELEQYKQENSEMINELNFLRRQLNGQTAGNHKANTSRGISSPTNPANSSPGEQQLHTSIETPATEKPMDESNIPEEFRPYYRRLQLHKVETLTSAEKSNLIIRIMLSLLVTDFDHLPSVMPQVGSYLRLTSKFLDNLHRKLYDNNEVGPLRYLRDYNLHTDDGLEECLNGMFNVLI